MDHELHKTKNRPMDVYQFFREETGAAEEGGPIMRHYACRYYYFVVSTTVKPSGEPVFEKVSRKWFDKGEKQFFYGECRCLFARATTREACWMSYGVYPRDLVGGRHVWCSAFLKQAEIISTMV